MKTITVIAATDQQSLEDKGADVEIECETLAEAKLRAKYYLSETYRNVCEASSLLGYSEVRVNGKCVADYFGKNK